MATTDRKLLVDSNVLLAFLAGKVFTQHRRRGGSKRSPLPDFYIGAHAAVRRMPLLTRDAKRYRGYFPGLRLIAPEDNT